MRLIIIHTMLAQTAEEQLEDLLTALEFSRLQKDVVRDICRSQSNND